MATKSDCGGYLVKRPSRVLDKISRTPHESIQKISRKDGKPQKQEHAAETETSFLHVPFMSTPIKVMREKNDLPNPYADPKTKGGAI